MVIVCCHGNNPSCCHGDSCWSSCQDCFLSLLDRELPSLTITSFSPCTSISTPGPAIPNPPVSLATLHVSHNEATIVWVVTEVAYTNESYIVQYGKDANGLASASPLVDGGIDFSTVDQEFETIIEGLKTDTQYYFTVLAINSEGNVSSVQGTFTTLQLREYKGINSILQ